ncbi:MAG: hypothetical protein IPM26_06345 [Saprospiraceae bacterium]|nr:hypothetical protein [Saprospiraceae bacterium]
MESLLLFFPEIELPVLLTEEMKDSFESENEMLPRELIDSYLAQWEQQIDEFTEFIPCFRLPAQEHFTALVYWKGSLLRYEYVIVTLDKKWNFISRKVIASTVVEGDKINRSIASIEPDLTINIIAGHETEGKDYDPARSRLYSMEILANGELIFDSDYRAINN